jgi:hypothetical protein
LDIHDVDTASSQGPIEGLREVGGRIKILVMMMMMMMMEGRECRILSFNQ